MKIGLSQWVCSAPPIWAHVLSATANSSYNSSRMAPASTDSLDTLAYLLLGAGLIGLILWLGWRYGRHLQSRKARESVSTAAPVKDMLSPFARFCQENPDFTQEKLLKQTARIFELLVQAFGARDLTTIRPLVDDACYTQLEKELSTYWADPPIIPVTQIRLMPCSITGYSRQAGQDRFILHLPIALTYAPVPEGMAYLEKQLVPRADYQWTLGRPRRLQTIKGPQI